MTSTDGQVIWISQNPLFNTPQDDLEPSIAVDASDNLYVSYQTMISGHLQVVVFELDMNGTFLKLTQTPFNTSIDDQFPKVVIAPIGILYGVYQTMGSFPSWIPPQTNTL